jgi:glyoxylase-like metal-dependent hydrolase (beta-lactamase superfamily II)
LLWELRRTGFRPSEITGVLLTHRHSDHAGNAAFLQRRFGMKVYAHREDAAVLDGTLPQPMLRGLRGGSPVAWAIAQFENVLPATRLRIDRALDDGDTVAGLEVHWMPGHTDGSVFYRHAPTKTILSGDMLLAAIPPLTLVQRMALPYPTFSRDLEQAFDSLRRFHREGPHYENLLAGHGRPVLGGAHEAATELLARAEKRQRSS